MQLAIKVTPSQTEAIPTFRNTVEARDSGFAHLQQNVYYLGRSTISEVS